MDQAVRNKLRSVVTQCRKLLERSVGETLQGQFGIYALGKKGDVKIEDEARMSHLSDEDRACRKDLIDHFEHIQALGYRPQDALAQLVREIAFTHLNRLCAYKMMEARGLIREAVSRGVKSQGFLFYLADHPEDEKRYNSGEQDVAYRHFLDWLGGTLSEEIGVLFNPNDPANRLYPPQRTLDGVLDLLNGGDIKPEETTLQEAWAGIWSQDETIGWVYQYFTPKELRDQARKESQAPRNSYELAFRNQFFTPRYVVEFLTDNTLGRIWYEMRKGDTKLKEQCRYMVRRPNESFLDEGQEPPENPESQDDLSQEERLKQPVHIPHRVKKDPRELKILDPACGSGHFLLYCFDLLLTIYEEAYADPDLGPALKQDYPAMEDLCQAVPGLILAQNLHGIDIDLRSTQIAALALWLRCQRDYREMSLKTERPEITRSNVVCAEPMPGEEQMLREFVGQLEPKLLGQLVEFVFDKMKLAGEAGSLLKIEDELRGAIAEAKKQWRQAPKELQLSLFESHTSPRKPEQQCLFDTTGVTDDEFWSEAETNVLSSLRRYATQATNRESLTRALFADDAERGFALIDVLHRQFDVILMNPPFGDPAIRANRYLQQSYIAAKHDLASAFVERALDLCSSDGLVGSITPRTLFFLSYLSHWREQTVVNRSTVYAFSDFGDGVLDATIETAAHVVGIRTRCKLTSWFSRHLVNDTRETDLREAVDKTANGAISPSVFLCDVDTFRAIERSPFAYAVPDEIRRIFGSLPSFETDTCKGFVGALTQDDFRFLRLWWETDPEIAGRDWTANSTAVWVPFTKGGSYTPYFADYPLTIRWDHDGQELKQFLTEYRKERGFADQWTSQLNAYDKYFRLGLTWSCRPNPQGSFWVLPKGCIFGNSGPAVQGTEDEVLWLLAIFNSRLYRALLDLLMPRGATSGQSLKYNLGYMRAVPVPACDGRSRSVLGAQVRACIKSLRSVASGDECSHIYDGPFLCKRTTHSSLATVLSSELSTMTAKAATVCDLCDEIERHVESAYAVSATGQSELYENTAASSLRDNIDSHPFLSGLSATDWVHRLISYVVGVAFGRWDIRRCLDCASSEASSDPFEALPIAPPATLQLDHPLTEYPIVVDCDGILVDDINHMDDIVRRCRDTLEALWQEQADSVERGSCETIGVKSLRDYFRKPTNGGLWDNHVKRYSRSRRKAPIYWLLQSSKKNYALWIYYHRLDKDILFKALVNYVEPKIRLEENRLESLRSRKSAGGGSKKLDKDIERQDDFLSELRDFEDKLRRAANLHLEPDLNDGVVLNIAPLWELVPWKEANKYWDELTKGKYEWSTIGRQLRERGLVK